MKWMRHLIRSFFFQCILYAALFPAVGSSAYRTPCAVFKFGPIRTWIWDIKSQDQEKLQQTTLVVSSKQIPKNWKIVLNFFFAQPAFGQDFLEPLNLRPDFQVLPSNLPKTPHLKQGACNQRVKHKGLGAQKKKTGRGGNLNPTWLDHCLFSILSLVEANNDLGKTKNTHTHTFVRIKIVIQSVFCGTLLPTKLSSGSVHSSRVSWDTTPHSSSVWEFDSPDHAPWDGHEGNSAV